MTRKTTMRHRCSKIEGESLRDPVMASKKWNPGKRIVGNPLGEASDSFLHEWIFYTRSTRSAKVTSSMNYAIKQNMQWIKELREAYAELRGITPEEMRKQVLEGTANYLEGDPDSDDRDEE